MVQLHGLITSIVGRTTNHDASIVNPDVPTTKHYSSSVSVDDGPPANAYGNSMKADAPTTNPKHNKTAKPENIKFGRSHFKINYLSIKNFI